MASRKSIHYSYYIIHGTFCLTQIKLQTIDKLSNPIGVPIDPLGLYRLDPLTRCPLDPLGPLHMLLDPHDPQDVPLTPWLPP